MSKFAVLVCALAISAPAFVSAQDASGTGAASGSNTALVGGVSGAQLTAAAVLAAGVIGATNSGGGGSSSTSTTSSTSTSN